MAVLYRSRADTKLTEANTKQKRLMWPDCLFGVVPQPTDSRLSETNSEIAAAQGQPHSLYLDIRLNCDKRY